MLNFEAIVRVPYTTLPVFEKYSGPYYIEHPSTEHIAAKRAVLEDDRTYGQSWFETPVSVENDLSNTAARCLGLSTNGRSTSGHASTSIKDLALVLQEDVAILHNGRLEACCFLFPSGWSPETKVGMNFSELHAPVADGERLRAAGDHIANLMCGEHSYHRFVWGLASTPLLSNHPRYDNKQAALKTTSDIWFRFEHQIAVPIVQGTTSLFVVDVQVVPYGDLSEAQRERIIVSINSMSPNVIKYKNIAAFGRVLGIS